MFQRRRINEQGALEFSLAGKKDQTNIFLVTTLSKKTLHFLKAFNCLILEHGRHENEEL
jgi:hypothetical protein